MNAIPRLQQKLNRFGNRSDVDKKFVTAKYPTDRLTGAGLFSSGNHLMDGGRNEASLNLIVGCIGFVRS